MGPCVNTYNTRWTAYIINVHTYVVELMPSNDSAVKHCMCLPLCRIIQYYVMREEAGILAPSSSEQHKVSVRGREAPTWTVLC